MSRFVKEAELHQCIYLLNQTGLTDDADSILFTDIDGLPSIIVAKLFGKRAKCYIELLGHILQPLAKSPLTLNDFEYIEKETLLSFLDVAVNNSFKGINVLIYGLAQVKQNSLKWWRIHLMQSLLVFKQLNHFKVEVNTK
ncbi:hypothetical protein [Psychromonas sp. Urea-02u-13]|uniref:hypothetical protein n=1 Tax=Psychromonas sp. Urea-02u-13 TaxID=2058326 RepID=UPI0012FEF003|nr:hypothetical protein [Psychromonas sp. Urea-02u-13]